jgi:pimeloyl-ACP methyl ester carboxylesterase
MCGSCADRVIAVVAGVRATSARDDLHRQRVRALSSLASGDAPLFVGSVVMVCAAVRLTDAFTRLRIAGMEALAMARQATLLHLDTARPVVPEGVRDGDDVVVLLHGLFATAGVLRPLRQAIGRLRDVHTATFTYAPGPDVASLSGELAALTAALPAGARLHLVGHSLGGVVARAYAHDHGDARVVQTISLAAPFAGVPGAGALAFGAARDLDPDSPLLRRLRIEASSTPIPHLSILAGGDTVVRPPLVHALPGGDVVVLEERGHNTLLFDDEAARLVKERIAAARPSR